jgi:hypothetical protein
MPTQTKVFIADVAKPACGHGRFAECSVHYPLDLDSEDPAGVSGSEVDGSLAVSSIRELYWDAERCLHAQPGEFC